ncbi:MAG: hypothetical protein ACFFCS_16950 [Candidatus Hodarchaeota archaeon]
MIAENKKTRDEEIEKNSEYEKNTRPSVRISTFLVRIALFTELIILVIYYICTGIYFLTLPDYFAWSAGFYISFGLLLAVGIIYLGIFHASHRFSIIATIGLGLISLSDPIWNPFLRNDLLFWEWSSLGIMYYIYGIIIIACGLFSIPHVIIISIARKKQARKEMLKLGRDGIKIGIIKRISQIQLRAFKRNFRKYKALHIACICALATSGLLALGFYEDWFSQNQVVIIKPADYKVEIAIFTQMEDTAYTVAQKEAFDRHETIIVCHDAPYFVTPDIWNADPFGWQVNITNTTAYLNARTWYVNKCNYWKSNYPGVCIMPVVHGIPCGTPTDLSASNGTHGVGGTIWMARQFLEIAVEDNLTNVVGIHTDQEDCQDHWDVDGNDLRDRERNHQANENWIAFFQWVNDSYSTPEWQVFFSSIPNRDKFTFQTTFGMLSGVDGLDGDDDMDVYVRNNVLRVPHWDDYTPMIYVDGAKSPDEGHYQLYQNLRAINDSLSHYGLEERIGAYLGIMGMGIFKGGSATLTQYEAGSQVVASGFDILVRQALIVKSFRAPRVSLFLGTTVGDMIGIFDAYGDDFLDDFNESVNGLGSNNSFDIPMVSCVNGLESYVLVDYLLTSAYNFPVIYAMLLGVVIGGPILCDVKIREKLFKYFGRR